MKEKNQKIMNEELYRMALPAFIFLCVILFLTSCGQSSVRIVQNCTVTEVDTGAQITCPDGTEVLVKKDKETIYDTVYIKSPKNSNKRGKHE